MTGGRRDHRGSRGRAALAVIALLAGCTAAPLTADGPKAVIGKRFRRTRASANACACHRPTVSSTRSKRANP